MVVMNKIYQAFDTIKLDERIKKKTYQKLEQQTKTRKYKGLVIHDHITLGLHNQYKDGKYERGWINTNIGDENPQMDK
jgi:hypothetical protein